MRKIFGLAPKTPEKPVPGGLETAAPEPNQTESN